MSAGVTSERLLSLALSRPAEALREADQILAGRPDAWVASIARQARAIVWRDAGRTAAAITELRRAVRDARASGQAERVADVQATLGLTLGFAGRTRSGLAMLDEAVAGSRGVPSGRNLMRRADLLRVLGRHDEALEDLRRAISLLRRGGDRLWEARSRMHRVLVLCAIGQTARADRDLTEAERLYQDLGGQDMELVNVLHNRSDLAYLAGDLAGALGYLDAAADRYARLGVHTYSYGLATDRCWVLLAAGLFTEAMTGAEETIRDHAARGDATQAADLLFAAGQAAYAAGRPALAVERAAAARDIFRRQGRERWHARASFVVLQSRWAEGHRDGRLVTRAGRLADRLDQLDALEAPAAHLLAGRLAAERGRHADADRHLTRAAHFRNRGPSFGHAVGWLAHALRAKGRGDTRAMLSACRFGLRAAENHRRTLAAPELLAHATVHGIELVELAQREAVARGDARMLLRWSERWRAGGLAVAAVRPPDDPELAAEMTALRSVEGRLAQARAAGLPVRQIEQERRALEGAIRARTRRVSGTHPTTDQPGTDRAPDPLSALGGHTLVTLTFLDGILYATTVAGGRARTQEVGPLATAVREVELARFALRRLARGRPPMGAGPALEAAGAALERALLGPAATLLGAGPVVVVPPAILHSVPWGMLPALRDTPFVVAPSLATWLRAGRTEHTGRRRVVLVRGPELDGTGLEIKHIARTYPQATVLENGSATAEAVLSALDGAWIAHIAAHGVFRGDNPLFSSLALDDGPLTVYDLGRLRRAPARLVLSSCESGVAAPVSTDELLGMVSALIPLGTRSLVASVVPVNDAVTSALMAEFHERLRAGQGFGAALRDVRQAAAGAGDVIALATAWSFVSLGR
ncbi:CHAT domain-containing tetratricopeptide repeat protein [Actinoplanes sp. NPDC089786]|uniref:CHAT domain-containing protein n=1 Tax=Actinoplanes sp. NPDC089786 TaxID=3155185 RepID=UPI00343270B5